MKIGIVGAGFTGLSAAYRLSKAGHDVEIFESGSKPGGLALGFKQKNWDWTLEEHYHHWFTNDDKVLGLAKKIGHPVIIKRPKSSVYRNGNIFQLDSPTSLLKVPELSILDKLRTGITLFYLKYITPWQALEGVTAEKFLKVTMGQKAWQVLWEPLFVGKFGKYSDQISASWFWARIKKRTPSLAYPEGGFQKFADCIHELIHSNSGKVYLNAKVEKIEKTKNGIVISANGKRYVFDKVICTLSTPTFLKLTKGLPKPYIKNLKPLKGIGAINLVLSLNKSFLIDNSYWLNINENDYPFVAVVEHTNFMDRKNYGNEHLLYIGNYFPTDHKYFNFSAKRLLKEYLPYLKKINKQFNSDQIIGSHLYKAQFAQPIMPLNYSETIPGIETPIKNLYLANMQMVYPWDRGTNYAVELGNKVSELVIESK